MISIPILLDGADATRVLDEDGVVVTAFAVAHDPVKPAFGYRFDYGGHEAEPPRAHHGAGGARER